jgi:nucleotide-binding universal stress UspA family protein
MKVLVPVDGSPASMRALQLAIEQVRAVAGGRLVVLNVQNLATLGLAEGGGLMPPEWIEQEEKTASAQALQDAVTACRAAGIAHTTRTERGAVAATIDRVARAEGASHITMGTRGLGGVRGLLLGSVTTQLLHLTDLPVTLVK